ncbi:DUF397 domain-containing protein [Catenuloplanes atrovinosus]|uniref:DUF397 domain-containing protein n=1 Tax=Catenuloplanes atrovinosus TaxID=137266 RepID=A0AAE3YQD1_9ACTN|nr:hypothetical protein [Catenuloplanes atrovinosus]
MKSSRSHANGNCVEVAADPGAIAVRDSKDPGPRLRFAEPAWRAFVRRVKG